MQYHQFLVKKIDMRNELSGLVSNCNLAKIVLHEPQSVLQWVRTNENPRNRTCVGQRGKTGESVDGGKTVQ